MAERTTSARGRPPSTTREQVATTALRLFAERGFNETTMDDIAAEVGIGRRTMFRYYPSKNDLVWGEFGAVLDRLREDLRAVDQDQPLMEVVREAAVRSNTYPDELLDELHRRLTLIQTVPALQAHSMLRYAEWRRVIAEYVAERLGQAANDLVPVAIGHAALAASSAAFSRWVAHRDEDILELLDRSYGLLVSGFDVTRSR
jgi:TetR/AcrR family transcriptional regulator, regulator of mycofactocin system